MTVKRKHLKYVPQRPGDHILIVVPNVWGRGPTHAKAEQSLRANGSGNYRTQEHVIYSAHPESFCQEVTGDVVSKTKPILLVQAVKNPN